ncbi:uncharacterized protein [Antedon mediterranea]|uniref:uncharacterized protein n=1 Tax=Antedon mediterranea TaxID=105859 RepID=UPI003AF8FCB2
MFLTTNSYVMLIAVLLLNTNQSSGFSCMTADNCFLILHQDGKYIYKEFTESDDDCSGPCYLFSLKTEKEESCLQTDKECALRGGKIASIDGDNYNGIKNMVLTIFIFQSTSTFNAIMGGQEEEQCINVSIHDGYIWNDATVTKIGEHDEYTVNSFLCEQVIDGPPKTALPSSTTLEKNQEDSEVEKISISTVVIIVVVVIIILALTIMLTAFLFKNKNKQTKRARAQIATVRTSCHLTPNVFNEPSKSNDDYYSTINVAYSKTIEPECVTSHDNHSRRHVELNVEVMGDQTYDRRIING